MNRGRRSDRTIASRSRLIDASGFNRTIRRSIVTIDPSATPFDSGGFKKNVIEPRDSLRSINRLLLTHAAGVLRPKVTGRYVVFRDSLLFFLSID